jgi:hypothetical protein
MTITKTKDRVVTLEACEDGFLLVERVRSVRRGYSRASWDESRVWLSPEELDAVAKTRELK